MLVQRVNNQLFFH